MFVLIFYIMRNVDDAYFQHCATFEILRTFTSVFLMVLTFSVVPNVDGGYFQHYT